MNNIEIKKDEEKIIYTNDTDVTYNVSGKLTVYNYINDKSINIIINLISEEAYVEYHLSTINTNDNKISVKVNHLKEKTTSKIYNHGVNLKDKNLTFDIYGVIPKTSSSSICNQENQIINIENGNSKINPNLLIENYDTVSSHSAYIGKFKDEKMFYLMSRGISKNVANNMLIKSLLLNGGDKDNLTVKEFLNSI